MHLAKKMNLTEIERQAKEDVRKSKQQAWEKYLLPIKIQVTKAVTLLKSLGTDQMKSLTKLADNLLAIREPMRSDVMKALQLLLNLVKAICRKAELRDYYNQLHLMNKRLLYNHLYNEGPEICFESAGSKA